MSYQIVRELRIKGDREKALKTPDFATLFQVIFYYIEY